MGCVVMRIALVAPPFISVPPPGYGGTELFIAHLANALTRRGQDVVVYANGASRPGCEVRWTYAEREWPLDPRKDSAIKNFEHSAWAVADILRDGGFDAVHVNDTVAVPLSRFLPAVVHTLHHPHEPAFSDVYVRHPRVSYVAISDAQRRLEPMPQMTTIHHGVQLEDYTLAERKQPWLAFLGRIAPMKGPHLAIEVAQKTGIPLKLAGEVQPVFQDYWETQVRPHIDGHFIEYVGEATLDIKNDLLGSASALLFPIQWEEPFGLVMIEAMACGTPVLALPGGSVVEIVRDEVSGWVCRDVDDLARRARGPLPSPQACRDYVTERFSVDRMAAAYEQVYERCQRDPAVSLAS
jgi:glycosyltransferase involved in cell wall biosynthesis